MKNHDTLLAKDGNLGSIQMRKEGGMLGHNRDANPGYKEKLHNMRGGENVTSGFTSGLRQNCFKDSVNSKLGLHADKNYAEPHHGVPQRLKNGGMADDSSMLNRGRGTSSEKDCDGGPIQKKGFGGQMLGHLAGSALSHIPGRAGEILGGLASSLGGFLPFEEGGAVPQKKSRGGSCNERAPGRPQMAAQFEKASRHGDSGQTQFAKHGHHGDAGQRQFEKKPARAKTGGEMEDMDSKIDKKAIGGVAKIRHGQMKHRDMA